MFVFPFFYQSRDGQVQRRRLNPFLISEDREVEAVCPNIEIPQTTNHVAPFQTHFGPAIVHTHEPVPIQIRYPFQSLVNLVKLGGGYKPHLGCPYHLDVEDVTIHLYTQINCRDGIIMFTPVLCVLHENSLRGSSNQPPPNRPSVYNLYIIHLSTILNSCLSLH
jgi:hypothetical protein